MALCKWILGIRAVTIFLIVCIVVLQTSCSSILKPKLKTQLVELRKGQYSVDAAHTTVLFKVDHMGFSKFVGRSNNFDASLTFDPDNPAASRLDATVNVGSIDVNNPSFEKTLVGAGWFDVEHYPQAVYRTKSARVVSHGVLEMTGDLTLRGETSTVVFTVKFNGGARNLLTGRYTIGFEANAEFLRSDFGMDKYIPMVGDEINVEVYAEFQRN